MPSMKPPSNSNHGNKEPIVIPEPNIPLPLQARHGGLGGVINPSDECLLVGAGKTFRVLESPKNENHFLITTKEGLAWSKYSLELTGHVKLDQSLHTKARPKFASLGIETDSEGISWLRRKNSKDDYYLSIDSDCNIDQDLSTKAKVQFESVDANLISVDLVKLLPNKMTAKEAGRGSIAMTPEGACMSDGEFWKTLHGNIHGSGYKNQLAFFDDTIQIRSSPSLVLIDGMLGILHDKPEYALHLGKVAKFNEGLIVGELSKDAPNYCFGLLDGRAGFAYPDGFMEFGSGHGNIKGSGKDHHLAMFDGTESIVNSGVYVTSKQVLTSEYLSTKEVFTNKIWFGDNELTADKSFVYFGGFPLARAFKRGTLKTNFGEISGRGFVLDDNLEINAYIASDKQMGIAQFNSDFTVNNGSVSISWDKAPQACEGYGLISRQEYDFFANKAQAFKRGRLIEGDGITISGDGSVLDSDLKISLKQGSDSEAGVVKMVGSDFLFKDGFVFLRNPPVKLEAIKELLSEKQDALKICSVTLGRGYVNDFSFGAIGSKDIKLDIALATYETYGVASFNKDNFSLDNGVVSLRTLKDASLENNGLMTAIHVKNMMNLNEYVSKCPQGSGAAGSLAIWTREGLSSVKDFENFNDGLRYKRTFEADTLRATKALILGTCDLTAEAVGAAAMRYERGCLEVSNGIEWISLRAGGLTGQGRGGSLAYWVDETSLNAPESLFWNEEKGFLGLGTDSPEAHLHIVTAKASINVTDTASSSPQRGGSIYLGSDDGSLLGKSDTLGRLTFGSRKALGASIRAYAAANWDSVSTPAGLAFGTTPDGQISPTDQMFLTQKGYLGIGLAAPLAPLHVQAQNKFGITGMFEGAVKIGASDASATNAGRGVLKYENGCLCMSDGISWRKLTMEAE